MQNLMKGAEGNSLKTKLPLKRVIQGSILVLMLLAVLAFWPLKLIRPFRYVGTIDPASRTIVMNEGTIMQQFVPENKYLETIRFYIYNENAQELEDATLVVRYFDSALNLIETQTVNLADQKIPGVCTLHLRGEWEAWTTYYFSLENPDAELLFSMSDGVNLDAAYGYRVFFGFPRYLIIASIILVVGAALIALTEFLCKNRKEELRTDMILRIPAGILTSGASLWVLFAVFPAKLFGTRPLDIVFYETGILLFLAGALYALFFSCGQPEREQIRLREMISKIPVLLQIIAFAGVMKGCTDYLNALCLFDQHAARNITIACFAFAILCSFSKKELFNWYNGIYCLPAIGVSVWYCIQNNQDADSLYLAKGTAIGYALWGLVLLNVIRNLIPRRREWKCLSKVYSFAFLALLILFVIYRHEKEWTILLLVGMILFVMRLMQNGGREQYLRSFVNGIFVQFICISFSAWLHRPFHYYTHTRYPGAFHTVTMGAVYDCLMLVLAVACFLVKYAKEKQLKKCIPELTISGLSFSFLMFTVSRTGLFTAAILIILLLAVTAFTEYKDGIKNAGKRVALLVATFAAFFVMTFTACRIVPAVYNDPKTYDIEWFPDSIKKGEAWDSFRYITVEKFFTLFDAKMSYYSEEDEGNTGGQSAGSATGAAFADDVSGNGKVLTNDKAGLGGNVDYTNGRIDVYKRYLATLNWTGHPYVELEKENGEKISHAHNAYIQVAYDFGIGTGIYFLLFCIFFGVRSILYYGRHRGEKAGMIPVVVIGVFGICGMVEWVMLPYIPTGFALFFVLALLTPKLGDAAESIEK